MNKADIKNDGKGSIFYGMHFYAGLAGYQENDAEYKVFLNEDTIRSMDPTFAGRPVFVLHVDGVDQNLNELRKEADGWVVESFYEPTDGKHWAKMVIVSDKAQDAIRRGMKLSNCYIPTDFGPRGTWNGIDYDKEITAGEYEHMAIVPNPRYEESIILTPEEFKKYKDTKLTELQKLSNHNDKGSSTMKFSFFKRTKVENSLDLENMLVLLPKTKREVSIEKLINDADEPEGHKMAHPDHMVDVGGERLTVKRLADCYKDSMDKMKDSEDEDEMEDKKKDSEKERPGEESKDMPEMNDEDEMMDAEDPKEDMDAKKKALELAEHEEKEIVEAKRKNAKARAAALKNAGPSLATTAPSAVLSDDRLALGKKLY